MDGSRVLLLSISMVSVLVAVAVGFWLMRAIQNPLSQVVSVLKTMARGDLRTKLDDSAHDEFGQLACDVNRLVDQLNDPIEGIIESAGTLNDSAAASKSLGDATQSEVEEQKAQTELAATAMSEVSATVAEIEQMISSLDEGAKQAMASMQESVDDAQRTLSFVESAGQIFESIAQSMKTIFDKSSQIATAAEQQRVTTEEVAKNVNLIADIAERTASSAVEARSGARAWPPWRVVCRVKSITSP